jgi:hypothetical protein
MILNVLCLGLTGNNQSVWARDSVEYSDGNVDIRWSDWDGTVHTESIIFILIVCPSGVEILPSS